METISTRLAKYANELDFNKLPAQVVKMAKLCIMDNLGVAIAGADAPWSKIVADYVRSLDGRQESSVIKNDFRTSSQNAAYANGSFAHAWEYDDAEKSMLHPGAVVIPAAIATAESSQADGKSLIVAIVAGYEVMIRVARAVNPKPQRDHSFRGFHPTSTCGPFGAAIAASRLMGLDSTKMADALGLAGSHASGLQEFLKDGSPIKRLHPGKAAHDGISSAQLAARGLAGPKTIFEGRDGFLRAFSDSTTEALLTEGLGENYLILETIFKKYPCCRGCHASIEAVLELRKKHHFEPNSIREISVRVPTHTFKDVADPEAQKMIPLTPLEAQQSLHYCLSTILIDDKMSIDSFSEKAIQRKSVLDLAKRVHVEVEKQMDNYPNSPSEATIIFGDGSAVSSKVDQASGGPNKPLSENELLSKFQENAAGMPNEEIVKVIDRLEQVEKISELTLLCSHVEPRRSEI